MSDKDIRWSFIFPHDDDNHFCWTADGTSSIDSLRVTRVEIEHEWMPCDPKAEDVRAFGDCHQFTISWKDPDDDGHYQQTFTVSEDVRQSIYVPIGLQDFPLVSDEVKQQRENQYRNDLKQWRADLKHPITVYQPRPGPSEPDYPTVILRIDEQRDFCFYFRKHTNSKPSKIQRAF